MTTEAVKKRKRRAELMQAKRQLDMQNLNRRAHWGTGVKITEYEDAVKDSVNLEPLEKALDGFKNENVVTESLFDNLSNQIDFSELFSDELSDKLAEIVAETFKLGGNRLITVDGDTLSVSFDAKPQRLISQLEEQEIYLKNLSEAAEETVRDTIIRGSEEGKSIGDMQDEILDNVDKMTENRAETIARTEVTKASNNGTEEAARQAGVTSMAVSAELDRQTCEAGTFEWRSRDGETYTSCEEWDGEVFSIDDVPPIPQSSHPNCRCALIIMSPD